MRKILIIALLVLVGPLPAFGATGTTYRGSLEVPTNGNITQDSGGTGCVVATGGVYSVANCPSGTAAINAGANITITGSNPYTINCPACFNTGTNNTVTGNTTFSQVATFSLGLSSAQGFTNSSTSSAIVSGTSGSFSSGFQIGTTGGFTSLSTTSTSIGTCAIAGNALAIFNQSATLIDTFDQSGNVCSSGTIYYVSSKSEKQDIHEADIDPLGVLAHADFNLFWRYKPGIGDPLQVHYGPMADSLPAYISGPNHGRIDLQALVNTEGAAINELNLRLNVAAFLIGLLLLWCLWLTVAVVRAR